MISYLSFIEISLEVISRDADIVTHAYWKLTKNWRSSQGTEVWAYQSYYSVYVF